MKPGVNEPIILNETIIGVVGITGHPDEVRRFSKLVRVTAVLLIEQANINEKEKNERLNRDKFYHELSHRKVEYDDDFNLRAKNYGLDLTKKCQVILVEGNMNSKSFRNLCDQYKHYWDLEKNRTVFFKTDKYKFNSLLRELEESIEVEKIGLGGEEKIAAVSLEKAVMAMEIGIKIKPYSKVYEYENLKFYIHLSYEHKESLVSLFNNLNKSGNKLELIQTLQIYVEENGDINNAAKRLNIHRNTLNYRLERIEQLTGKNPKILLELFELLCGYIWMQA
jgi:carbohydrate diacid regulator